MQCAVYAKRIGQVDKVDCQVHLVSYPFVDSRRALEAHHATSRSARVEITLRDRGQHKAVIPYSLQSRRLLNSIGKQHLKKLHALARSAQTVERRMVQALTKYPARFVK